VSAGFHCRSCTGGDLSPVLSLGELPLANALLMEGAPAEPESRYPLELVFCRGCALLQITETVAPETLFRDYRYFSSYSETFVNHAAALAARLVKSRGLGASSLIVEAASNDGYLLKRYKALGTRVLGIEPAVNVAVHAEEVHGIPTLKEFFGVALARRLADEGRHADVFHAHNVLAHVADLNGFVEGIRVVLRTTGVAVIEVPYVKEMIDRCEFDTIYHEHLCYFSLASLARLFERHGLVVIDVVRVPVHGGSLQLLVAPAGQAAPAASVASLAAEEAEWGVDRAESYGTFSTGVARLRTTLRGLLLDLTSRGKRIVGYGAAAKATVLLNVLSLPPGTVEYVVDRSPHKQGRWIPGVRIPIVAPERLSTEKPDYVLLLAWNLADEVLAQQAEYRRSGGRFIVPLPEPRVV
jgi:SAM-dependent methyltransferase